MADRRLALNECCVGIWWPIGLIWPTKLVAYAGAASVLF